jgi:CheY-like chemotaxis protein
MKNSDSFNHDFTVLVVEDDEINSLYIETVLEPKGYKVVKAFDGTEAIDVVHKIAVDLILMDINLPEMSGLEAMQSIRLSQPLLPIVAQTAMALNNQLKEFSDSGFDAILIKPFSPNDLNRVISAFYPYHSEKNRTRV